MLSTDVTFIIKAYGTGKTLSQLGPEEKVNFKILFPFNISRKTLGTADVTIHKVYINAHRIHHTSF